MYILGINSGVHDASACLYRDYELLAALSLERLKRRKNAGVTPDVDIPLAAIDECLGIAGIGRGDVGMICATRGEFEVQRFRLHGLRALKQRYCRLVGHKELGAINHFLRRQGETDPKAIFDLDGLRRDYGFANAGIHFCDHHAAHGVAAYFYSRFDDALIYTADGIGDEISYSARTGRRGVIDILFGDGPLPARYAANSIGNLYGYFTEALGFIQNRHEGKLTGLAGYGKPVAVDRILSRYRVDARGEVSADFADFAEMRRFAYEVCAGLSREDAASSIQAALETLICDAVGKLVRITGLRAVAAAGGVFANVRLNRAVLETTGAERLFVFPAMSDEGLPVGGCLIYLHERDGAETWQRNRVALESLYLGRDHAARFDASAAQVAGIVREDHRPVERAVEALIAGEVVAIYTGRMEFGPRALGARSILASPVRRDVNDTINKRLERSEFMPFAPVVLVEHAARVFDVNDGNAHAAQFMTITCDVRDDWRARIPAVVHVDGSARPQVIREQDNPLYFRVLSLFHERTGIPVLVNTSFNVHEEPIVDTPEQALASLRDGRVDRILTADALYRIAR